MIIAPVTLWNTCWTFGKKKGKHNIISTKKGRNRRPSPRIVKGKTTCANQGIAVVRQSLQYISAITSFNILSMVFDVLEGAWGYIWS